MRILIADDHEAVREGVCAILSSRLDIEVCGEAVNGKEAIDKAKELNPDLIILDVTMPVMNGLDAARELGICFRRPPFSYFPCMRAGNL